MREASRPSLDRPQSGAHWAARMTQRADAAPSLLRAGAAARFTEVGLPTSHHEDWRFTPLGSITQLAWEAAGRGEGLTLAAADRLAMGDSSWHRLVFVNGRLVPALSRVGTLPAGVRLGGIERALSVDGKPLSSFLGHHASFEQHAFTALNTALFEDGLCLHIAPGVELETPVELLFLASPAGRSISVHPRNLIVLGANARATVVETYRSLADRAHFTNPVTEAVVGAGAHLTHYKLGLESEKASHVGRTAVTHGRDSRLTSLAVTLGGAMHRNDLDVVMDGAGCEVSLNGLYMGRGQQIADNHTSIRHVHPDCASREVYVGILDGQAHGIFNGKVYVTPEAQKTDGKQTNRNLLLSDRARVDTKPQLEIFADDVKCTHGATVGRLDEVGLFYLRSRGLAEPLARKVLTYAFAAEVLEEVPFPALRRRLESLVMDRLEVPPED
ncbi:MAG TPA: Fe-S cluster assembly protein SufD [Gemmatimonadales bacterium]|nr:Fe-S cluster assembly protein SufD [Gemmatimonadales bacterium]